MEQGCFLAIDAFRLVSEPKTSGAFVVSELVREISRHPNIKKIFLLVPEKPSSNFSFQDLLANNKIDILCPEKPCAPHRNFRNSLKWIQFEIPKLIKNVEITHFLAPYHQAPIFLKHQIKVITIIHDICGILPSAGANYFKKSPYRHWINFFTALARSDAFIYDSEFTKSSFEHLFHSSKKKPCRVIYPKPTITPVSDKATIERLISQWGISYKEYFFALGAEGLRKGTDLTLGAYRQYLASGGKKKLVLLVANDSISFFSQNIKDLAGDVILVNSLKNAERDALYAGANALVFPSRGEGFGYPILEAMCQGCPPIALDNSPAKEITAGCVQNLDSLQIEEIVGLMRVYETISLENRKVLEDKLIFRANEFIAQIDLTQKFISLLQSI